MFIYIMHSFFLYSRLYNIWCVVQRLIKMGAPWQEPAILMCTDILKSGSSGMIVYLRFFFFFATKYSEFVSYNWRDKIMFYLKQVCDSLFCFGED